MHNSHHRLFTSLYVHFQSIADLRLIRLATEVLAEEHAAHHRRAIGQAELEMVRARQAESVASRVRVNQRGVYPKMVVRCGMINKEMYSKCCARAKYIRVAKENNSKGKL